MNSLNIKYLKKTFDLQQDQIDCGVSCLSSLIKYYGGFSSFESIRNLSGTTITGTTLLGLYQAANKLGFNAEGCEADIEALRNHPSPVILHVTINNNTEHFIIVYGIIHKNGLEYFTVGDPAKGIIEMSTAELNEIWKSKSCLTLEVNTNFKKETALKNQKKTLLIQFLKDDYSLLGIAAGLGIGIALLGLAMAIFSQKLIDEILPNKNFVKLNLGVGLLLSLLLIKEIFSALRQFFLITQSKKINIRITDFFFNHLLKLPISFFDTRKTGDFIARLNDTSRIQQTISRIASNVIIDILILFVTLGFLFYTSWNTALICIAALPFYFLLIFKQRKLILTNQKNTMVSYAVSESNFISTLQGIQPLKNFGRESEFQEKNKLDYENYQDKIFTLGKLQIKISFFANCFGVIFIIGILFYNSYSVLHGLLKIGELMAIVAMASSLMPSISNLALISIPISEAKIAFDRMFEFTSIEAEENHLPSNIINLTSLKINNISFRFPGRKNLLRNLNIEVTKGEIIAIMGENGCGKSTLTQIIQKTYSYEGGEITVNNNTFLSNISISNWRQCISIVPQNIHIFNCSVLENIAFEDAKTKTKDVIIFLTNLGFGYFLDKLPQSVFTLVGEEGVNLSGGQKQIIALARALYHNPQLLVLDEATSAMDRESEQFTLHLLSKLKSQMAIIFITHRLHVLKSFCDKIYILEDGTITSHGNHDLLLQSENLYSKYWSDLVS